MDEDDGQSAAQAAEDLEAAKDLGAAAEAHYKQATEANKSSRAVKTAVRGLAQQAEGVGPLILERLANEAERECSKGRVACGTLRAASAELQRLKRRADRAHERAKANEVADAADNDGEPMRCASRRAVRLALLANNSRRIGERLRAVVALSDSTDRRQETAEGVAGSLTSRLQQAPTGKEQEVVLQALQNSTSRIWNAGSQALVLASQGGAGAASQGDASQGGAGASQGDASQGNASQATTEAAPYEADASQPSSSQLTTETAPDLGSVIDYARAAGAQQAGGVREPVIASIAAAALAAWRGDEPEDQAAADDPESGSPSARWDDIAAWTPGLAKQSCVDVRLLALVTRLGTDVATVDVLAGDAVPPTCTEGTLERATAQFTALAGPEVQVPEVDLRDSRIFSSADLFAAAYWPFFATDEAARAEAAEACKHLTDDYCYSRSDHTLGARRCGLCIRYSRFVPRVVRLLECAPLQPHPRAFFRVDRGEEPAFPAAFFCTAAGLRALHSAAEACATELAASGNSLLKAHRAKRSLKAHERCDCLSTAERIRELRNESHASCPTCWLTLPDVERPDWVEAAEGLHQQAQRSRH